MRRMGCAPLSQLPRHSYIRNIPVEVSLDRSDGMPAGCVANLDDITTLPKVLIKQRITALSAEKIRQIDEATGLRWIWIRYSNGSEIRGAWLTMSRLSKRRRE
jgi:mRNA-degrading endonuclease toxin of MazEF toxin-antitoxin module